MANELHQEGLEYLLKAALSEEISVPVTFYVGLASDSAPAEDAALSDLTEMASSNGYARQTINSDATDCVVADAGTNDKKCTMQVVTFTASGGPIGPFNIWFLATTVDDTGKLVASGPVSGAPMTLTAGSSYKVTPVLKLSG